MKPPYRTLVFLLAALPLTTALAGAPAPAQGAPAITYISSHDAFDWQMLSITVGSPSFLKGIVTGAPYSAEMASESVQVLASGNRIATRTFSQVYRDSAGRTRREAPRTDGTTSVQINDPVGKVGYILRPRDKSGLKMHVPREAAADPQRAPREAARADSPAGTAAARNLATALAPAITAAAADAKWRQKSVTKDLGQRHIEGLLARGTLESYEIPAEEIGNERPIAVSTERWVSDELSLPLYSRTVDPRIGERITRYTNIKREDVPAAMFSAPADYTIKEVNRP